MKTHQKVKEGTVHYENVHVFIMDNYGYRRVSIYDVLYLKAASNYCDIHLADKSRITVSVPMCEVTEYFPPTLFIRIHRSFVVNLGHISRYAGNIVRMSDGRDINIGREYQSAVKSRFVLIGSRKRVREKVNRRDRVDETAE